MLAYIYFKLLPVISVISYFLTIRTYGQKSSQCFNFSLAGFFQGIGLAGSKRVFKLIRAVNQGNPWRQLMACSLLQVRAERVPVHPAGHPHRQRQDHEQQQ